jgi:tetrahydromethanopterin S-methyltransferase subunit F
MRHVGSEPVRSWARIVVLTSALPFAAVGLAFLAAPEAMAPLVGLEPTNVTADNDLRAVYGGLSLGLAVFLLWCGLREDRLQAGVHAQVFTFGGLAGGRIVSLVLRGAPDAIGFALHAAEVAGLICGLVALFQLRGGPVSERPTSGTSHS